MFAITVFTGQTRLLNKPYWNLWKLLNAQMQRKQRAEKFRHWENGDFNNSAVGSGIETKCSFLSSDKDANEIVNSFSTIRYVQKLKNFNVSPSHRRVEHWVNYDHQSIVPYRTNFHSIKFWARWRNIDFFYSLHNSLDDLFPCSKSIEKIFTYFDISLVLSSNTTRNTFDIILHITSKHDEWLISYTEMLIDRKNFHRRAYKNRNINSTNTIEIFKFFVWKIWQGQKNYLLERPRLK